jgi:hypothetical protein
VDDDHIKGGEVEKAADSTIARIQLPHVVAGQLLDRSHVLEQVSGMPGSVVAQKQNGQGLPTANRYFTAVM